MIVFELTMPNRGSWDSNWSGGDSRYIRTRHESSVPKKLWNTEHRYDWPDGWTACVSVRQMSANEARELEKQYSGFCGYDWMIRSLIRDGYIHPEETTGG